MPRIQTWRFRQFSSGCRRNCRTTSVPSAKKTAVVEICQIIRPLDFIPPSYPAGQGEGERDGGSVVQSRGSAPKKQDGAADAGASGHVMDDSAEHSRDCAPAG